MRRTPFQPAIAASLLAALLFGASTPIARQLLREVSPILLAGLLYLGSGIGFALVRVACCVSPYDGACSALEAESDRPVKSAKRSLGGPLSTSATGRELLSPPAFWSMLPLVSTSRPADTRGTVNNFQRGSQWHRNAGDQLLAHSVPTHSARSDYAVRRNQRPGRLQRHAGRRAAQGSVHSLADARGGWRRSTCAPGTYGAAVPSPRV